MAVIVLLNNFMHDFSAAGWLFASVVLLWCLRHRPAGAEAAAYRREMLGLMLRLMKGCFWGIVLFGIGRVLAYKRYEWSDAAANGQLFLLGAKHVLLTLVFALGAHGWFRARRELRGA